MVWKTVGGKLCLWVLLAALGGCVAPALQPASVAVTPALLAGTEWVAFSIEGAPEVVTPKPTLRWVNGSRVSGTGGCNAFRGLSTSAQGGLRLGPLSPTGSACLTLPGAQEDLFFKAIELTRNAYLQGDQLVLVDESGRPLARLIRVN